MLSRTEALAAARKLARTFASAPDSRRQARLILSTLEGAGPWDASLREALDRFTLWLDASPPTGELRVRCVDLVARFPSPGA